MRSALFLCVALSISALAPLSRAAETVLRVSYDGRTAVFSAADLAAMHHITVKALDGHDRKVHEYTGIAAHDVLAQVGVPSGEKMRGPALRLIVIARAKDGYEVALSLAEFDEMFSDRQILLVDQEDGLPLPQKVGPLHLLLPGDKRTARWARMVNSLEVVQVGESRK